MKAEELMICDWVLDGKKPAKITGIMCCDYFETTLSPGVDGECISPIPLTAEILEKNGFGYKEEDDYLTHYYLGDGWYLDNPDLHIGTYNKGVYWLNYCDNAIYGIKFVHELQHALRLCGIEKEIEL